MRSGARATMSIAILSVAAVGCAGHTSDRDLVLIDAPEAVQLMEGGKKLLGLGGPTNSVWVDPRSPHHFRLGHIPGAVNVPFQNISDEHHRLRGYDVLIVYGDQYRDSKAAGMSKRLMQLGYKDVRTLRGGLQAWRDAGRELEKGDP